VSLWKAASYAISTRLSFLTMRISMILAIAVAPLYASLRPLGDRFDFHFAALLQFLFSDIRQICSRYAAPVLDVFLA
jgi:hypothetical protein